MCRKSHNNVRHADHLPKAINIETLHDLKQDLNEEKGQGIEDTGPTVAELCPDHGEELKVHCTTCNKIICFECLANKHHNHRYKKLADYYNERKCKIEEKITDLGTEITKLLHANHHLEEFEKQLWQNGEVLKIDIVTRFEEVATKLNDHKDHLLALVDEEVQSKVYRVEQYRRSASEVIQRMSAAKNNLESHTRTWSRSRLIPNDKQLANLSEVENIKPILSIARKIFKSPAYNINMKFEGLPIKDETMKFGQIQETRRIRSKLIVRRLVKTFWSSFIFPLFSSMCTCTLKNMAIAALCVAFLIIFIF